MKLDTKTAKGLTYLNLGALLLEVVFMFVLIPIFNAFFEMIQSRIIFILSIIFVVFNAFFYCAPVKYKAMYFKYRYVAVYLPTLIVIGFGIWSVVSVIIRFDVVGIPGLLFSVVSCITPVTFSMLITKLLSDGGAPLLG